MLHPPIPLRLAAVLLACLRLSAGVRGQEAGVSWRTVGPGVEHAQLTRGTAGPEGATGPWIINLLRVNLPAVDIDIVRALDEGVGVETVSSLAARHGALAAVNGGFFQTTGTYRGNPAGLLQINGTMLSEPDRAHAAMGLVRTTDGTRVIIGEVATEATVTIAGRRRQLSGLNRPRGVDEIILFTPEFHRTTLTGPEGVEVVVRRGTIESVHDGAGSSPIPPDGLVLSARGAGRQWLLEHARPGGPVETSIRLRPVNPGTQDLWSRADDIVSAGPAIVAAGQVVPITRPAQARPQPSDDRPPRTAVGVLADGRVLFATVDGRRPPISIGMTFEELGRLMIEFGATDAMNLDGGGSTTMVVEGRVVNTPSDAAGERPVSDAIIIRARPRR